MVFVLVRSTFYTGRPHEVVKQERREITVGPNSGRLVDLFTPSHTKLFCSARILNGSYFQ